MSVNGNHQVNSRTLKLIQNHQPGYSLAQPFYNDPDIFELEIEKILLCSWLYAGHVSRIPKQGDFFLCEFGDESVIVIRGDEDEVHALINVCRHRGTRVCVEPSGNAQSLVCPYHQWVYNCDGSLRTARLMPADFDKSQFGLHRAHAQVVEGFIFVCLAEDPPRLEPSLRDIRPHIEPYELAQAKICHTETYDLQANWKILNENFRECYHCGGNHPELCDLMPHIKLESAEGFEAFQQRIAACQTEWKKMGVPTHNVPVSSENSHHVFRFPFKEGFVSQTMDGQVVAPLLGRFTEPDVGIVAASILPTLWFEVSVDYAVAMQLVPARPTLTKIRADWLVRGDAVEGVDYDVHRVVDFWRVTLEQDWKLCEDNQKGINSRFYQPGPYAPGVDKNSSLGEKGPQAFTEWYLRQLTVV
jgi:Rieske 2Fe-2S family protein